MAQITHGVRSILSHPAIYNFMQWLVGAEKARKRLVNDYFPLKPGMRILDIGCGTAEILRHLPEDIVYTGFDASEAYIRQAKDRFGSRGEFHAELVEQSTFRELGSFDLIFAFGLLHHLDDDAALALFELAKRGLKPEGKLVTIDPCYTDGQHPLARWMISKDRGRSIRTPEGYMALANSHFEHIECNVRHDMLHIPYSHTILECFASGQI